MSCSSYTTVSFFLSTFRPWARVPTHMYVYIYIILYYTILYYTILYYYNYTILYYTKLYYTILY